MNYAIQEILTILVVTCSW